MSEQIIDSFFGEYRFLSNFYPSEIEYNRVVYPTVEHAYQAQKTTNSAERLEIATCGTPGRAKRLGNKVQLRKDWESVKVQIMRDLIRLKFTCHAELATMLLETGESQLIEGNTWNDRFWGVCGKHGKNWLGRILMEIRSELQTAADPVQS